MTDVESKRRREKRIAEHMIRLHCRKKHRGKERICPECAELLAYVHRSVDQCPFMRTKTFCSQCRRPCYSEDKRKRIREVMRFSGPRILFSYPMEVFRHWRGRVSNASFKR